MHIEEKKVRYWYQIKTEFSGKVDRLSKIIRILKSNFHNFNEFQVMEGNKNVQKTIIKAQKGFFTQYNARERLLDLYIGYCMGKKLLLKVLWESMGYIMKQ